MYEIDELLRKSKDPKTLKPDGNYTVPRSYGVYKIKASGNVGRRFRFGNHPVRMNEIEREYGVCSVEALFADREDAKALTALLNRG